MKIPFDRKFKPQIESGEYKIETECCNPAVVLDWDYNYNGKHSIAVKVPGKACDRSYVYDDQGKPLTMLGACLFLVTPEPELTEFEKALVSMLVEATGKQESEIKVGAVKDTAKELLELARKELESYHDESNPKIEAIADLERAVSCGGKLPIWLEDKFKEQREQGKAEALKDLPRWKKATRDIDAGSIDFAVFHKNDGGDNEDWLSVEVTNRLYKGEYYLELSDLEKIPKDD